MRRNESPKGVSLAVDWLYHLYITKACVGCEIDKQHSYRNVAQLAARMLWEHNVAGSNPVIPTIALARTAIFIVCRNNLLR